jgi:hypothetical protein
MHDLPDAQLGVAVPSQSGSAKSAVEPTMPPRR